MADRLLQARIESGGGLIDHEFLLNNRIVGFYGNGETGKSSAVEFLEAALSATVRKEQINNNSKLFNGWVDFQKGDKKYRIKMTCTKVRANIKVTCSDKSSGGKEFLREIIGPVAIDPLALKAKKVSEQTEFLKKMAKIDTTDYDQRYLSLEEDRKIVGRNIDSIKGFLIEDGQNSITLEQRAEKYKEPKPLGLLPDLLEQAEVQVKERVEKSSQIVAITGNIETLESNINHADADIERMHKEILEIQRKITEKEQLKETYLSTGEKLHKQKQEIATWLEEFPEPDTKAIQAQIDEIREFNTEQAAFQVYLRKIEEKNVAEKKWDDLTAQLQKIDKERDLYIQGKVSGIPDFEFRRPTYNEKGELIDDSDGPYYQGKMIKQLSTSGLFKWYVQFRKAIDKLEGRDSSLPVIIIDEGERLGSEPIEELQKLVDQEGYQVIFSEMDRNQPELVFSLEERFDRLPKAKRIPAKRKSVEPSQPDPAVKPEADTQTTRETE